MVVLLVTFAFLSIGCTKKVDDKDTTLNIHLQSNVKGLDPATASDLYSSEVMGQIYETLFAYHYLKRPLELVPLLAEAMPESSKDGLTITIKIKKGIKYQDDSCFKNNGGKGREVVAQDFVYAFKRIADPSTKSDGYWIFEDKIKGLGEWREKLHKKEVTFDAPIEGLQTPDTNTLVIKLTQPYFQLLYVLAMEYTAPLPRECVETYREEFLNHPIGTNAYKLESWTRNSKITLVKNQNFHGDTYPTEGAPGDSEAGLLQDAGKPLPFNERVVFHEIIEDQPRWLNFMKGELDFAGIPKDNFDNAIKDGKLLPELDKKGVKLTVSVDPDLTYTAFNMEDPVLGKNKLLRQALTMATDHKLLIERFYNGRAVSAQSPIPPEVDGYDENFKNPLKSGTLEQAKELLKKAGFPDGKGLPEFVFDTTSSATSRQMAENLQIEYAKLGVKLTIKTSTWPEFTARVKEKKAQIWGMAWGADYPDAQNFLQLFYSKNASPGPNGSNFKNKKFDELYEQALKLPPGPERMKLYYALRDIVVDEAPVAFNVHRLAYRVSFGWLQNMKTNRISHNYAKYYRIDPKKRAELKSKL